MSKRTWGMGGIEVAKTPKKEQGGVPALGQRDGGGQVTGNLAVLGTARCIGFAG